MCRCRAPISALGNPVRADRRQHRITAQMQRPIIPLMTRQWNTVGDRIMSGLLDASISTTSPAMRAGRTFAVVIIDRCTGQPDPRIAILGRLAARRRTARRMLSLPTNRFLVGPASSRTALPR
jgi:hypothetical protein